MTWPTARDILAFGIGTAILAHETVVQVGERPTHIGAALALMGAPAFFRKDDKRNGKP